MMIMGKTTEEFTITAHYVCLKALKVPNYILPG